MDRRRGRGRRRYDRLGDPHANEAPQVFGYGPVAGGDTPYMQQQNFSLAALAARDATQPLATPSAAAVPAARPPAADVVEEPVAG